MQGRKTKSSREIAREEKQHHQQQQQSSSSKGQAWFCTTGLPSDVVIEVGDMTFHLHKFPLMSRSKKLHDLITNRESRAAGGVEQQEEEEDAGEIREEEVVLEADEESDVHRIRLPAFPGGAEAFEQAAKFCYGVKLDLTPATAAPLRCAAERLGMSDDHSDDNLISRADRFISHTVLRNPRDAIRALRSCESLLPLADNLGLVSRCVDAIAAKAAASTPTALFGWPVTDAAGGGADRPRRKNNAGAGATWFDDLAGLSLATFTRVIAAMKERGVGPEIVEGALIAYAKRSIPGLSRSGRHIGGGGGGGATAAAAAPPSSDGEQKALLETVIANLPEETIKSNAHTGTAMGATTARVLFGLLRTTSILQASESSRDMLERRIAARLPDAAVDDLLIPSYSYLVETLYDVDCVERIVRYFLEGRDADEGNDDSSEPATPGREASRRAMLSVGRLMDAYLGEIAADANLKPDKFCDLAWALPDGARVYDDGLYRAVDIYLKAHPGLREEEKEKISGVVDGRKLTLEACTHAAQNERLPLRTVVQVLFFEQLQLRRAIARTIMANEGGAAGQGEEEGDSDAGGTWRVATRGNQMLRLDMDSMRNRVQELERECTSMRRAIEKMDRRGGGSTPGERGATPAMEGRWGSMVTKRFGCKFPAQVCQSQQRTVVARPRRPRIEQSP
ncbi:BTB/POZ domain-containing protein At5g66560-like [Oryza brachyantha]|uniref:BTB/POZ domain-containing protein At5g66560-like n=1 Tax=Oryza brachyantha TaxID=4533 RepID=UPI001ADB5713|nr:BTB/POZ domain-containing protein At5g66560-like [Oryza brachyantha]